MIIMNSQEEKCIMIIDEMLPLGLIANTAAILGITIGEKMPEIVGGDITDKNGNRHLGIIEFPVTVLRGTAERIKELRQKLSNEEELLVVDFSDLAQSCKTYDEFREKMADASEDSLQYLGLAVCGPKKKINRFTGSMPLLR
ncbi:hypothetical protein IMSAG049_00325 [Clostridiales bacterium]|nr:hypothetical protein IMSAG049_00325 [Clostridiales bacterium]